MNYKISDKIAVFPGSFDPITLGHVDIVKRALLLFDKIYVVLGVNNNKTALFNIEQRVEWIRQTFTDEDRVIVAVHEGLIVDFCRQVEASCIIRGLRNCADYRYEKEIAQVNKELQGEIETLFLNCAPQYAHLSSSMIRELIRFKADVSIYVPIVVQF